MGYDCGFDMVPRLTNTKSDNERWTAFIEEVKQLYLYDPVLQIEGGQIRFSIGEHPLLPLEGHKFLRFSCKVNGQLSATAELYIRKVCRVARKHFGEKIKYWNEGSDSHGHYGWLEVRESIESYGDSLSTAKNIGAANPSHAKGLPTDEPMTAEHDTPPRSFVQRFIPGKGQGLIAAHDILKGTRILSEKPLFTVRRLVSNNEELVQLLTQKLKLLSKDEQRAFLSLHNSYQGTMSPFVGIMKTNALPMGPDSAVAGLFLQVSRINQACLPSCQHTWNESLGKETVHAVRDIFKGEEITLNYAVLGPSKVRGQFLKANFGFDCACNICNLSEIEQILSDDRMKEIKRLDAIIGDGEHIMKNPRRHLHDVHTLAGFLDAEGIRDARLPRLYYDAFQTVVLHGDQARAKVFAERAYVSRVVCEGEDSPVTMQMKALVTNPKIHPLFGISSRWEQAQKKIPKDLKGEELEKWLWRV